MDNDLLNIWLKARNGLPVDEARDLVARVETLEEERDEAERQPSYTQDEMDDEGDRQRDEGASIGFHDAVAEAILQAEAAHHESAGDKREGWAEALAMLRRLRGRR